MLSPSDDVHPDLELARTERRAAMRTTVSALPLEFAVRSPEGAQEVSVFSPTDGGTLPGWPPTGTIFHLTLETADGFEHNYGLPSDGSALSTSTKLNPKWLRKPLQKALIAPLLNELNGEIYVRYRADIGRI